MPNFALGFPEREGFDNILTFAITREGEEVGYISVREDLDDPRLLIIEDIAVDDGPGSLGTITLRKFMLEIRNKWFPKTSMISGTRSSGIRFKDRDIEREIKLGSFSPISTSINIPKRYEVLD